MAKQSTYYLEQHVHPSCVVVKSSFTTKSESVPTVIEGQTVPTAGKGPGYSVSAPVAAIYTITGNGGPYHRVVNAFCKIRDKTSASSKTCFFSEIVATTDPWTATLVTQSTPGTAATLSGPIVDFEITFAEGEEMK